MKWAAAALLLATATSCGGGSNADEPTREELVDALVDGGVAPVDARCWVGEVYDDLSVADMRAIQRADSAYGDFDNADAVEAAGQVCL